MPLAKQAKTLNKGQIEATLGFLDKSRYPIRNRLILLLSVKAGLRAKEIANLTWSMVTDSEGDIAPSIDLHDKASKGRSGRSIPIHRDLRSALTDYRRDRPPSAADQRIIATERSSHTTPQVIVNLFGRWYRTLGFNGCSSHSGRRTFITNVARRISTVGGSLRDVQILAGHANLATTQRYIETNVEAQKRVVDLV